MRTAVQCRLEVRVVASTSCGSAGGSLRPRPARSHEQNPRLGRNRRLHLIPGNAPVDHASQEDHGGTALSPCRPGGSYGHREGAPSPSCLRRAPASDRRLGRPGLVVAPLRLLQDNCGGSYKPPAKNAHRTPLADGLGMGRRIFGFFASSKQVRGAYCRERSRMSAMGRKRTSPVRLDRTVGCWRQMQLSGARVRCPSELHQDLGDLSGSLVAPSARRAVPRRPKALHEMLGTGIPSHEQPPAHSNRSVRSRRCRRLRQSGR
jgi:hypothetical protein